MGEEMRGQTAVEYVAHRNKIPPFSGRPDRQERRLFTRWMQTNTE